jgi:Protein of unknown function (DUF2917)
MLCDGYDKVFDLDHGDLVELQDARGTTLRVTRGTIWITQEHDTQDIVLRAGDVWTVERQGLTLVEAQGDALVCVVGVRASLVHSRDRAVSLADRVRSWLDWTANRHKRTVPYY